MEEVLVVGLGNPGDKYAGTRHNAGVMLLDRIGRGCGIGIDRRKFSGMYGSGVVGGVKVHLLFPLTFMNLSGRSVLEASQFFGIGLGNIVVLHDELDLSLGDIRVKRGGGLGGHNGLKSIAGLLGGQDFFRFRLGIGRPLRGEVVDYVLGRFSQAEASEFSQVLEIGYDAFRRFLSDGVESSMNYCNGLFKSHKDKTGG